VVRRDRATELGREAFDSKTLTGLQDHPVTAGKADGVAAPSAIYSARAPVDLAMRAQRPESVRVSAASAVAGR